MSRMMPAWLRAEGVKLYEAGLMLDVTIEDFKLSANIEDDQVVYDLDGQQDFCSCAEFQRNHRYCKHIAAVEEYLKNENTDDVAFEEKEIIELIDRPVYSPGANFLKWINGEEQLGLSREEFSLEVYAIDSSEIYDYFSTENSICFDLRLYSRNLGRSYVIKDIPYFLRSLQHSGKYSLGSLHYVDLLFEHFEEESQAFLSFLLNISSKTDELTGTGIYIKGGRFLNLPQLFLEEAMDLASQLENFQLKIADYKGAYFAFVDLDAEAELYQFTVRPGKDYIHLDIQEQLYQVNSYFEGNLIYYDRIFYRVDPIQKHLMKLIQRQKQEHVLLDFAYSEKDNLAQALQQFEYIGKVTAPSSFKVKAFKPKFYFDMEDDRNIISLKMQFDYGQEGIIESFHELETLGFSRDLRLESRIFSLLEHFAFSKAFDSQLRLEKNLIQNLFLKIIPAFKRLGNVFLSDSISEREFNDLPEIQIERNGGLLDISFDLPNVAEDEFATIIAQLQNNAEHYISKSGKFYLFDEKFNSLKSAIQELDTDFIIKGNSIELAATRSFQVSKIFENISSTSFSENFKAFCKHLAEPDTFPYEQPEQMAASLRPYQETGVKWMNMLTNYHLGGILADDMGLGKTLQAITFLMSNLKDKENSLIVAPASLTYNWSSEFEKFTKGLDFIVVDGSKTERATMIEENHQVYITSYGSFLKDFDDYQDKKLTYLLLDEAQVVKNYSSKTNQALSRLKVEHIFALSGTPLENRLEEIWSIFQVVMPGLLPKREKFNKMSAKAVSRIISPFVLRRKKEDVLEELPDKLETTLYNELAKEQKLIYLAQLQSMQQRVAEMDTKTLSRSRIEILSGITRLRQICDSPALFMDDFKANSGKVDSLIELLEQVKSSGHRPLIFSQFTKMFPIIEQEMEKLGMSSYKLTGSTPVKDRISMVQAFNAGSRDAFLISLKAGGVGLNLTSADVVILVDLWWNPAVEEQAIARAHRMGQKNTVEVIRLITKGTIEEKIMEIQERKRDLISNILDGDPVDKALSELEIREILGLGH